MRVTGSLMSSEPLPKFLGIAADVESRIVGRERPKVPSGREPASACGVSLVRASRAIQVSSRSRQVVGCRTDPFEPIRPSSCTPANQTQRGKRPPSREGTARVRRYVERGPWHPHPCQLKYPDNTPTLPLRPRSAMDRVVLPLVEHQPEQIPRLKKNRQHIDISGEIVLLFDV